MFHNVLYSLEIPCTGRRITGYSRQTGQVLLTCKVDRAIALSPVVAERAYQVRTLDGASYLVHVLPEEARLDAETHDCYTTLCRRSDAAQRTCSPGACACEKSSPKPAGTQVYLLRLLFILGLLSLAFGSQELFGMQIWDLFLEVFKILIRT